MHAFKHSDLGRYTLDVFTHNTVGPHYMREIGTPRIDSQIMNSHIKKTKDDW